MEDIQRNGVYDVKRLWRQHSERNEFGCILNLSCFAHSLQLFVNDGLQAQQAVIDFVAKTQKIATRFKLSLLAVQSAETLKYSG